MENEQKYIYIGLLKQCELGILEVPFLKGNAYKRIEYILNGAECEFVTTDNIANSVPITFPLAKMEWGNITHFGIFDKINDGKLLAIGDLTRKGIVHEGMQVQFDPGTLLIDITVLGELNNG